MKLKSNHRIARQPRDDTPSVLVLGTVDTKGSSLSVLCNQLRSYGCRPLIVDLGTRKGRIRSPAQMLDISPRPRRSFNSRAEAIASQEKAIADAAPRIIQEHRISAILAVGGSAGASLASKFMVFAHDIPCFILTTTPRAAWDGSVKPHLTVVHSPVDFMGDNEFLRVVLDQTACQVSAVARQKHEVQTSDPHVIITQLGVTAAGAELTGNLLSAAGIRPIYVHGVQGANEFIISLLKRGNAVGLIEMALSDLATGAIHPRFTHPVNRLSFAVAYRFPLVVTLGGANSLLFPTRDGVPHHLRRDRMYAFPTLGVTVVRANRQDCRIIGRHLARTLSPAAQQIDVVAPNGWSAPDSVDGERGQTWSGHPGKPWYDQNANEALLNSFRSATSNPHISLRRLQSHLNSYPAARSIAGAFLRQLASRRKDDLRIS